MRVKYQHGDSIKCWIPIDKHMKTIAHLIKYINSKVLINNHKPTINLYLDGFQLLPSSQINDVLRENELITSEVVIRLKRKSSMLEGQDNLKVVSKSRRIESSISKSSDEDSSSSESSSSSSSESNSDEPNGKKEQKPVPAKVVPKALRTESSSSSESSDEEGSSSSESSNSSSSGSCSDEGENGKEEQKPIPAQTLSQMLAEKKQLLIQSSKAIPSNTSTIKNKPLTTTQMKMAKNKKKILNKLASSNVSHIKFDHDNGNTDAQPIVPAIIPSIQPIQPESLAKSQPIDYQVDEDEHYSPENSKKKGIFRNVYLDDSFNFPIEIEESNGGEKQNNVENVANNKEPIKKVDTNIKEATKIVYEDLPKLSKYGPTAGSIIAFKELTLSAACNPILSDWKEATVIDFNPVSSTVNLKFDETIKQQDETFDEYEKEIQRQLDWPGRKKTGLEKFSIEEEWQEGSEELVKSLFLSDLIDARLVQ